MSDWWKRFGDFKPGYRNYPHAGQVLRSYRELNGMTQAEVGELVGVEESTVSRFESEGTGLDSVSRLRDIAKHLDIPLVLFGLAEIEPDKLGSVVHNHRVERGWTCSQLAQAVDLTERSIHYMEKQNTSLDSLSRRRALQFLLTIPPASLGLDALHFMETSGIAMTASSSPSLAAIKVVQENLWTGYYGGSAQDHIEQARYAISQIKDTLPSLPTTEHSTWLEQQSLLYQGLALVTKGCTQPAKAIAYSEQSVKVALKSKNAKLLSSALLRQMSIAYKLGNEKQAVKLAKEFRETSRLAPSQRIVLARVLSLDITDQAGRSTVLSLLDEQNWSLDKTFHPYRWGTDTDISLVESAEALLNLSANGPRDALYLLKQADELPDRVNRDRTSFPSGVLCWFNVVQSRIQLALGKYKEATQSALEALPKLAENNRNFVPQLVKISRTLQQSKYAQSKEGSPLVARLGWLLFQEGAI